MTLIKKIEIHYLRALYSVELDDLNKLNIISGLNDVGKSTLLKALNLFFNNVFDWQVPFNFENNFSSKRKTIAQQTKSQQTIWIAVTFNRPDTYLNSLPTTFRVRRLWNLNGEMSQTDDLETRLKQNDAPQITIKKARQALNNLISNRIRFEYVPAVRDKNYFQHLLGMLQGALIDDTSRDPIAEAASELHRSIEDKTQTLREEFRRLTGVKTNIQLPASMKYLLETAGNVQADDVRLSMRGDGIQALYIPSMLHFITKRSRKHFIWGFEEPENSLEYSRVVNAAETFENVYSNSAQIFVTTHSPAFISRRSDRVSIYRVYRNEDSDIHVIQAFPSQNPSGTDELDAEMGLLKISEEVNNLYNDLKKDHEELVAHKHELLERIRHQERPVIYVEGINDVYTLEAAWKKCYLNEPMPFAIKSCDPLAGDGGGNGGVETLQRLLDVVPKDAPYISIGIFDCDVAGLSIFNKLSNFEGAQSRAINDTKAQVRLGKFKRKVAALVIPTAIAPENRSAYSNVENMPLELYFSDSVLEEAGVKFKYCIQLKGQAKKEVNVDLLTQLGINQPEKYREFEDDEQKASFARRIAGKAQKHRNETNLDLSQDEFKAFYSLFELINQLVYEITARTKSIEALNSLKEEDDKSLDGME